MRHGKCCSIGVGLICAIVVSTAVRAQVLPTNTYYLAITNLTGATLKSALHDLIKGHTVIPYSSSGLDTHDALNMLDQDPTNSNNVILIYSGYSVPKTNWDNGTSSAWNREHMYPESFGTDSGNQNSDLFNLRACDSGVNSSRGNKYYDVSTGIINHNVDAPNSSYDADSWEPEDADKGFVARACFYISTRYDQTDSGGELDLQLADSINQSGHIFAKLTTLLEWNRRFPPTDWERTRNSAICLNYQHNRNPFIDNPDFADMEFLGVDGFTAWQGMHFTAAEVSNATISATTADPDHDGVPNLVEYALGHDPHVSEPVIQSLTTQTDGGTNFLYVAHHRNHYLSGVTLAYQTSTNLISWTDVAGEVIGDTQIDPQKDLVTARFPANEPVTFVRFRVRRLSDVPPGDAFLSVTPLGDFVSSGTVGGPFSPVSQTYTLSNTGGSNLTWTASKTVNWLDLSATSGILAPGSNATVMVSINANANGLPSNIYSDNVLFSNATSGGGTTTRSITLTIVDLAPVVVPSGSTMLSENCTPPNGSIDPGETVTLNLSLQNVGTGDTSNLVATLVGSDAVTSPSAPQTYGVVVHGGSAVAQSFTFTAEGVCGGSLTVTLQLQDGATDLGTINYPFTLGQTGGSAAEDFDGATAPSLPTDWTTSASGMQSDWATATGTADTSPNAAFSPDVAGIGVNELDSPSFYVNSVSAKLTFRQNYNLSASTTNSSLGYDGGVLEISIGGGAFQDILTAGGSFVSGGYNRTLSSDSGNPLAGRQGWSGTSGGFITTTVNLPSAAAGQNIQLRWRCGTGNLPPSLLGSSGTNAYWSFDATNAIVTTTAPAISASPITVANLGGSGSLTFFQGNPTNVPGAAIGASGFTTLSGPPSNTFSYFAFFLAVTNTYQASLSSISFEDRASATGPANFTVQVSTQSSFSASSVIYNSDIQSSHVSSTVVFGTNTLAMTVSGLAGTNYFRIYAYHAGGSTGTWRVDNLNVQGSVIGLSTIGTGWYIDSVSISDTTCCSGP